jgi:hypothetical protein
VCRRNLPKLEMYGWVVPGNCEYRFMRDHRYMYSIYPVGLYLLLMRSSSSRSLIYLIINFALRPPIRRIWAD